MSEENAQKLKSLPIRDIPIELLTEYQDAAKPERLNLSELKYFAPRYFELIGDFQFPSSEPLLSLNRFGYFNDSSWTSNESELLDQFAMVFFRKYIRLKPSDTSISPIELLLMFYKGNFKIDSLLQEWEHSNEKQSLRHFSNLLDGLKINKRGAIKVGNAFSDEVFNKQICGWLESKEVKSVFKHKMEEAIMNSEGFYTEKELEELSWKYEVIS